jgi:hypothetical protein
MSQRKRLSELLYENDQYQLDEAGFGSALAAFGRDVRHGTGSEKSKAAYKAHAAAYKANPRAPEPSFHDLMGRSKKAAGSTASHVASKISSIVSGKHTYNKGDYKRPTGQDRDLHKHLAMAQDHRGEAKHHFARAQEHHEKARDHGEQAAHHIRAEAQKNYGSSLTSPKPQFQPGQGQQGQQAPQGGGGSSHLRDALQHADMAGHHAKKRDEHLGLAKHHTEKSKAHLAAIHSIKRGR